MIDLLITGGTYFDDEQHRRCIYCRSSDENYTDDYIKHSRNCIVTEIEEFLKIEKNYLPEKEINPRKRLYNIEELLYNAENLLEQITRRGFFLVRGTYFDDDKGKFCDHCHSYEKDYMGDIKHNEDCIITRVENFLDEVEYEGIC